MQESTATPPGWAVAKFRAKVPVGLPDSDCWVWAGEITLAGYGRIRRSRGRRKPGESMYAHRLAYEMFVGPIPEGLVIDHLCRNRACVNPAHLEPVTHVENVMRGVGVAAVNARKTHCKNGHEFTPENTYVRPGGDRLCRTCRTDYRREWWLTHER